MLRGDGRGQLRIAALEEADEPALEDRPLQQDMTIAGVATQPDVRPEAIHLPRVATTGMAPS